MDDIRNKKENYTNHKTLLKSSRTSVPKQCGTCTRGYVLGHSGVQEKSSLMVKKQTNKRTVVMEQ